MKIKRGILLGVTLFIILLNLSWIFIYSRPAETALTAFVGLRNFIWRAASAIGQITLIIGGLGINVYVDSPQNDTYNFNIGEEYTLEINTSADFTADAWWFTLEDLKHNTIINNSVLFTPNETFNAVRWSNNLTVYANNSAGSIGSANVVFFVSVPNSAPEITGIDSAIYVCESDYLSSYFNGTDIDEDILISDISQKNPFYVVPIQSTGQTITKFEIISGTLGKTEAGGVNNGWKTYEETLSVNDGTTLAYGYTNITVIEINQEPSVQTIGVQTIYSHGDESSFDMQVSATDTEDGNQNSGNLIFNITVHNSTGKDVGLFNISQAGEMDYNATTADIGVYTVSLCVIDLGLDNPHEGIEGNCSQTGEPIESCQNFSLTVTDENRAPTITDYYPTNLNININATENLIFNISKYDPDETIPDAYWYVDNVFKEYDSGSSVDEFSHTFGCDSSGTHTIEVNITDGIVNDSIEWTYNVTYEACPVPSAGAGAGGGGGGGMPICVPKWGCENWDLCQNAEKSLILGILAREDYRDIQEECVMRRLDEKTCGFQIRTCSDVKGCNSSLYKPSEVQFCHYTESPNCHDEIKNCHDGECELLIDCGGICGACPNCEDKMQNQNEEGVDCGGPCKSCEVEVPKTKEVNKLYVLLIAVIAILLIVLAVKLIRIFRVGRNIKKRR